MSNRRLSFLFFLRRAWHLEGREERSGERWKEGRVSSSPDRFTELISALIAVPVLPSPPDILLTSCAAPLKRGAMTPEAPSHRLQFAGQVKPTNYIW